MDNEGLDVFCLLSSGGNIFSHKPRGTIPNTPSVQIKVTVCNRIYFKFTNFNKCIPLYNVVIFLEHYMKNRARLPYAIFRKSELITENLDCLINV